MKITCHHCKSENGIPVILDDEGSPMSYKNGLTATLKKLCWSRKDFASRLGYKSKRSVDKFWQEAIPPAHVLNVLSVELRKPPRIEQGNIDSIQLKAIADAHKQARGATHEARLKIKDAVDANRLCAELIGKVEEFHKGDLLGYLLPVLHGQEVKDYRSFLDANRKRDALQEKRQLHLMGVLDQRSNTEQRHDRQIRKPSTLSYLLKISRKLEKKIKARPVSEWTESEKDQIKSTLLPINEISKALD